MSYTSAGTLVSSLPVSCHCQVGVPVGRHQPTRLPLGPGTVAGGRLDGGADDGPAAGTDGAAPDDGDTTGGLVKIADGRSDPATTSATDSAAAASTTRAATTARRTRR